MHSLRTTLTILALTVPLTTTVAAVEPAAAGESPVIGGPRVRPYEARSAALLLEGIRRSDTFRVLVDRLEARDVIVYLQMEPALKEPLVGMLTWLTATRYFRYVRISLSPELGADAAIAVLGHELQHALEVANEPSIVDTNSLAGFYQRTGIRTSRRENGWDTLAARNTGNGIRRDLSTSRMPPVSELRQPFNPLEWHIVYNRARESAR